MQLPVYPPALVLVAGEKVKIYLLFGLYPRANLLNVRTNIKPHLPSLLPFLSTPAYIQNRICLQNLLTNCCSDTTKFPSLVKMVRVLATRTRWGDVSIPTLTQLTGLPTAITAPMTTKQVEAYALHVRIQEITQKLRIDDVVPTSQCRRSLSPAPTYDTSGRRTNTRHQRHRARLEDELDSLVQAVIETATSTPEVANERKVQQLRDLAVVNGTFRDYEGEGGLRDEPRQEWMATEHKSPPGRTWGWGSC